MAHLLYQGGKTFILDITSSYSLMNVSGLVNTRISASEKDLPLILPLFQNIVPTRSFTSVEKFKFGWNLPLSAEAN